MLEFSAGKVEFLDFSDMKELMRVFFSQQTLAHRSPDFLRASSSPKPVVFKSRPEVTAEPEEVDLEGGVVCEVEGTPLRGVDFELGELFEESPE